LQIRWNRPTKVDAFGESDMLLSVESRFMRRADRNRYPLPDWVPLPSAACVPVTFRLHQQVYLNPYPKELMLRNHV